VVVAAFTQINREAVLSGQPAFEILRKCSVALDECRQMRQEVGLARRSPSTVAATIEGPSSPSRPRLATAANGVVAPVHDRMPVILPQADFPRWLDPNAPLTDLSGLIRPGAEAELQAVPVGPWVKDARHEGPCCIQLVSEQGHLDLTAG
jgi:hypothetical protein